MATIDNPDPDSSGSPSSKKMRLPGGTIRYRDTYGDAKAPASTDPNNPYANNVYKIKMTSQIWEQIRPCRKDVYNHSYAKYHLKGVQDDHSDFLTTGYMLGLNDINHSLNPQTGEWDSPECFCFLPTDVMCNPLPVKSWFELHANNGTFVTSYNDKFEKGEKVSGSWKPNSCLQNFSLKAPHHYTRHSALIDWLDSLDRRNKIPMIPGLNVRGYNGIFDLSACNRWIITSSSGGNMIAYFCPLGCTSSLCANREMRFEIQMTDSIANVKYTGPTGGIAYDVYWFDEYLFTIYAGSTKETITRSGSVSCAKLDNDNPWIYAGSSLDCCEDNTRFPGKVFCVDADRIEIGPEYPDCAGGHSVTSWFDISDNPIDIEPKKRNPEFMFYTQDVTSSGSKCNAGLYCDERGFQNWYPCGGLWITFIRSSDGASVIGNGFPDVDFTTEGPHPCWNPWAGGLNGVDTIKCMVRNSKGWANCTGTGVCRININDALETEDIFTDLCKDDD